MPRNIKKQQTQKKYIGVRKINKSKKNVIYGIGGISGIGGGFMDFVIREEIDTSDKLPFGLSKFNPSRYFKSTQVNANSYHVFYNYRTPYQIDLTYKQNQLLQSNQVINKPHIFLPNMNTYLISLVELPATPNARLLWLASYKNRSWEHDILSYIPPSPTQAQTRSYALLVYKYPLNVSVEQIYKPIEMTTTKRKEEYRNFQIYLAANKMIQPIPGLSKKFRVQYNSGNALSFLSNVLVGKTKYGSIKQDKLALRQALPKI